ncbi:unnamed protein product, partial [Prorocentrum cordatum]
ALDPDSDSDSDAEDSDDRPEYAVLDMNVPRTALVINVSHVLKRLNGCCSLNQLTKSIKSFKESTGVTLEAFLRAHPNNFKLEGRIVFLVDRDGNKWEPPMDARKGEVAVVKGKGKGKAKDGRSLLLAADARWEGGVSRGIAGGRVALGMAILGIWSPQGCSVAHWEPPPEFVARSPGSALQSDPWSKRGGRFSHCVQGMP